MPFIHHTRALTLTRPRGVALHLLARLEGEGDGGRVTEGMREPVCRVHAPSVRIRRTGEGEESVLCGDREGDCARGGRKGSPEPLRGGGEGEVMGYGAGGRGAGRGTTARRVRVREGEIGA